MTSPNREWLAYYTSIMEGSDLRSVQITLDNPSTTQEIQRVFKNLALFGPFAWANDDIFVIPAGNEGEQYEWILWEPFTDQERTLSLELTGMGNAIERFHTEPVLDPTLSMVVYPCDWDQCSEAEYQVKSLTTGESLWAIDFRTLDPFRDRPVWSPDGQYLGILVSEGSDLYHLLRVYDRTGTLVHELALPEAGLSLTWSPDSRYLAFFRTVPGPVEEVVRVLTYLDLNDGAMYDLCLTDSAGAYPIVWSPDSTKLAINAQLEYAENSPALLSIVDIASGDIVQVYQTEWRSLQGWIQPIEE